LDTKRLEPYFQLSKPQGASAADSIHLHYPFDFVAIAPIKAFRRRHWSVFLSGTTTAIIFWVVTPLLGAVFTEDHVIRSLNSTALTNADLELNAINQKKLNAGIMTDAYGITWLGQEFPSFVNAEVAVSPFQLELQDQPLSPREMWTTTTNLYTTQLTCTSAKVGGNPNTGPTFDDGQGCQTDPVAPLTAKGYRAIYMGYFNDPHVDWSLSYLGCRAISRQTFLAIWAAVDNSTYTKTTALFCKPTYAVQRVQATVAAANGSLIDTLPIGPPMPLSEELFNVTEFAYLLGAGLPDQSLRAEVTESRVIDQWNRLQHIEISWPVGNMVGFALGASKRPPDDFFDPAVLASSYQSAHQLLFGLAIRSMVSNKTTAPDWRHGSVASEVRAIVVVQPLAAVVEAFLGLVTLFVLSLLMVSSTRRSQLYADPASISDIIELIKVSGSRSLIVSKLMDLNDGASRFKLREGKLSACFADSATTSTRNPSVTQLSPSLKTHKETLTQLNRTQRPFEMKWISGIPFITILLVAVIALMTVYIRIAEDNGLPLPSNSQVVNQLVLNYIPVTFATLLEPFWVLLNRMLCILQPFEEIRNGRAKPSQSFDVKYTSLPPQLIFWRALRARHLLLVALCLIGFSANFLAVALGALFEDSFVQSQSPLEFSQIITPIINQTALDRLTQDSPNAYEEHWYVAKSNLTDGTQLPAWIAPHLFFAPFDLSANRRHSDTLLYSALTQGMELNAQCVQLNSSDSNTTIWYNRTEPSSPFLEINTTRAHDRNRNSSLTGMTCVTQPYTTLGIPTDINRTYAAELFGSVIPFSQDPSAEEEEFCSRQWVAGFLRARRTASIDSTEAEPRRSTASGYEISKALYVGCQLSVRLASFDVTVDEEGRIQRYHQESPFSEAAFPLPYDGNVSSLYDGINTAMWSGGKGADSWHTDNIAESWVQYLIKSRMGSSAFQDPNLAPPSIETIGPVLEDISARLFAIVLGINTDIFLPAVAGSTTPGRIITQAHKVFMSRHMFVASLILIVLNVFVAVLFYARRPARMLKEMPTTIASLLKLVEGSGLAVDNADAKSRAEWQIGYGRYMGTDGKPHIGIERRPYIESLLETTYAADAWGVVHAPEGGSRRDDPCDAYTLRFGHGYFRQAAVALTGSPDILLPQAQAWCLDLHADVLLYRLPSVMVAERSALGGFRMPGADIDMEAISNVLLQQHDIPNNRWLAAVSPRGLRVVARCTLATVVVRLA
ncbi:MAG: hypothetical protein Q9205_005820, partial [Flavoplaca limonia]